MNSRWFLVQGTTVKRVTMENEILRATLKELGKTRDQGRNEDHLRKLIGKLQRIQALGPPASRARSPSAEVAEVAHVVGKYLDAMSLCSKRSGTRDHLRESGSSLIVNCMQYGLCGNCPNGGKWSAKVTQSATDQPSELVLECTVCSRTVRFQLSQ